jgi:hypothetical protein
MESNEGRVEIEIETGVGIGIIVDKGGRKNIKSESETDEPQIQFVDIEEHGRFVKHIFSIFQRKKPEAVK